MKQISPSDAPTPAIELTLSRTNVPERALPRGEHGEFLVLPTAARVTVTRDVLCLEVVLTNPESESEEPDGSVVPITLKAESLLRLETGREAWLRGSHPAAHIRFKDPLGIEEALYFELASTDYNNPDYALKLLAKLVQQELGIPVTDVRPVRDSDTPF